MRTLLAAILLCLTATWAVADDRLVTPPELRREERRPLSEQVLDPPCVIKGNINSKGEAIYYEPRNANYHSVRVERGTGERWFCTAEDARRAGFRPARR
jgi:hypothetical protein